MNRKAVIWLVILAAFAILFVRYYNRGPARNYSDFRVYHTTAVRFVQGADIYDTSDTSVTPFKYSPMFALLISPLAFLPIHGASLVFFTMNFVLLLFLGIHSRRLIMGKNVHSRHELILYIVPAIFIFRFALLVLDSGQVNLLILSLALAGIYLIEEKGGIRGGALLGLSVMIKYVTFIFLPYLILRKKWKAVFSMLASIAVYSVLPVLACGVERTWQYTAKWMPFITQTSLDRGSWVDYKNQSIYSFITRYIMIDSPYRDIFNSIQLFNFQQALLIAIGLSVILYAIALLSGIGKGATPVMTYAALFAGISLFNPNCWPFNFVSLFFPVMALTYACLWEEFSDWWTIGLCAASFIMLNIGSLVPNENFKYMTEVLFFQMSGCLLMYLAAVRLNLLRGKRVFE